MHVCVCEWERKKGALLLVVVVANALLRPERVRALVSALARLSLITIHAEAKRMYVVALGLCS